MRIFAASDLHVGHRANKAEVLRVAGELSPTDDWLILAGDVSETEEDLASVLDAFRAFARLVWVPGNHELWTIPSTSGDLGPSARGQAKYERMVDVCRARGVLTPEDPFPELPGTDGVFLAPLFLLYDYTFRPPHLGSTAETLEWAAEHGIVCTDEAVLHPDPHGSREAWCRARVEATARRLDELPPGAQTILVNHFPLRQAHARLPLVPRFTPWCGTTMTNDWHVRYRAHVVVYGHLHIPRTHHEDGVAFEEVSYGYPRQRMFRKNPMLRQVWPR